MKRNFSISNFKKHVIIIACFLYTVCIGFVFAQEEEENIYKWEDQKAVDSIKTLYNNKFSFGEDTRILLIKIVQNETNPEEKFYYSELLIEEALKDDLNEYAAVGYLQKGNALQVKGEFHEAIEAYYKSMELAEKNNDEEMSASLLVSIADTYSMLENSESAEKYYDEAIMLLRKLNYPNSLASALLDAGDEYYKTRQYNKALTNFEESGVIFDNLNYKIGKAYNIGNIGMVYAKQGKDELAKINMNKAIKILEENEDFYPISEFLNYMSDLYQDQNKYNEALEYAERSLELGKKYGLKDQISDANLQLSQLLEN